jgi:hypothetical protein
VTCKQRLIIKKKVKWHVYYTLLLWKGVQTIQGKVIRVSLMMPFHQTLKHEIYSSCFYYYAVLKYDDSQLIPMYVIADYHECHA